MIRDDYSFSEFLKSIEDFNFIEAFAKTSEEKRSAEYLARREFHKSKNQQNYQVIRYEKQLGDLLFWFYGGTKPAGLSETEFQLIKPFCEKLIEKGNLKSSALNAFLN